MNNLDLAFAESVSTTHASYFVFVYLLVLIYCCFGLAIVCDVYFVPALQKLSDTYDLPPDIAGSTLMALGASVPELFASLIGVFVTEDDIGTGSIIGSSCFNLVAVPAACAFVASATFDKKLTISSTPVIRNSAFYAITILVLLLIIKDNKVDILEGGILLIFFFMYMAFMIFSVKANKNIQDSTQSSLVSSYVSNNSSDSAIAECNAKSETGSNRIHKSTDFCKNLYFNERNNSNNHIIQQSERSLDYRKGIDERTPLVSGPRAKLENDIVTQVNHQNPYQTIMMLNDNSYKGSHYASRDGTIITNNDQQQVDLTDSVRLNLGIAIKNSTCLANSHHMSIKNQQLYHSFSASGRVENAVGDSGGDHEDNWVSSKWILVPMLPLTLSMKVLTPCKFKSTCWTIWTFLVSIALIGGLTYVSVWMVHLFGKSVGIPETIAGMTILSWGTGIPELIASIVLIKKTAQADMAICNTIGSNVIDISFCLSLPWIVKCILNRTEGAKPEVDIQSAALPWTCFTLLIAALLLILVFKLHNWELSFSAGVWLLVIYISFVVIATYLEYRFSGIKPSFF